jgi:hypothetical protein
MEHHVKLSTTEYIYGNDMLVHLQIGKNFSVRINELLRYDFKKDANFQDEQFLFKKTYNNGEVKPTTRSTFDEKLKRFDMSQTVIKQEILEEYSYTDKNGKSETVEIVVRESDLVMTATIDFKDMAQYNNFVSPVWLAPFV